jgi:putative peptide zinc metalloprotease protein
MRQDLQVFAADHSNSSWTIKDPVRLSYFRVQTEELEALRMLDGQRTSQQISESLQTRFPDVNFSERSLKAFLGTAIRAGLLIPTGIGYGAQLAEQARQARWSSVSRKAMSLISHRFRGVDPTPVLQFLHRGLAWIYQPVILKLATLFVAAVCLLIVARLPKLMAELPTLHQLLTSENVLLLTLTIAVVKVIHELGHGLTCHHYGGECHELGCIVIGFLPLLYCDVSDSWLQKNRVHRMQVAAAGIAVEAFLAAVFGLLWMASVPGLAHSFFLNVMLVCSVNTVLINGNPLLRYDGYYVLSDAVGIPNLGAESRGAALAIFDRIVLGLNSTVLLPNVGWHRIWLPVYGAASLIYRVMITFTILLVIHNILKPMRMESVTAILAGSVLLGMATGVLIFARQRLHAVRSSGRSAVRSVLGLVACSGLLAAICLWPLPHSVEVPCTLTPGVSAPVYVSVPGHIHALINIGTHVEAGQLVAKLENPELKLAEAKLAGEVRLRETRVQHLSGTRTGINSSPSASALPAAEDALRSSKLRLQALQKKRDRLQLSSPATGILYPPRQRPQQNTSVVQQAFWSGQPLDPHNHNAWLSEQTLLGWVGQPDQLRLTAYVPQESIEFVQREAQVDIAFHSLPAVPVSGNVTAIGSAPETQAPAELAASGQLATTDTTGTLATPLFAVHIQLQSTPGQPVPPLYATGFARITCPPRTLAARFWRLVSHTFAFEL